MTTSQCLPHYTTKYLKGECHPIGNPGQTFTDYRPSQVTLVNNILNGYPSNHQLRKHMIDTAHKQRSNNECISKNKVSCHYLGASEKCVGTK